MSFQNKYRTLPRKVSLYNVNINVCKNNKKKNILQEKRIFFIHSIYNPQNEMFVPFRTKRSIS